MGISTGRKWVALMLIIMLVVTHVESITPSQEFADAPIKFPYPPCDVKCTIICGLKRTIDFALCMKDCMNRCSVSPTV